MIDLHCHSTFSDGTCTPTEIIETACQTGITAIALTDHDTTAGLQEFHESAKHRDIETISGIELAVSWYRSSVHLTGLFIDENSDYLQNYLVTVKRNRNIRNENIITKINALGYNVTLDDWQNEAKNEVPGRPHLATILVEKGMFSNTREVFDKLIGNNLPGFVKRYQPAPQEGIKAIHEAGGLAFWAHPCAMQNRPYSTIKKVGATLKNFGLDGLETRYSHFTPHEQNNAERFAKQFEVLESGGSDFHGDNSVGVFLGLGKKDGFNIPDEFLVKIKAQLNR
ncbi:MAG: PHP domain-containing protein [Lentisphaeria bacterium]|nr:PHP domain-containing protein [Lentisphaeria bacterium]